MTTYNLWKSDYSGVIYKMPLWFEPKYPGWTLIGTVTE